MSFKRRYWYPISVDIERLYKKTIRRINRHYRRNWYIWFAFYIMIILSLAFIAMKHDYDLIENYSHFEALNEGVYLEWRTDGHPGQEPPKN